MWDGAPRELHFAAQTARAASVTIEASPSGNSKAPWRFAKQAVGKSCGSKPLTSHPFRGLKLVTRVKKFIQVANHLLTWGYVRRSMGVQSRMISWLEQVAQMGLSLNW